MPRPEPKPTAPTLTRAAVDLLLELLETREPVISAAAIEVVGPSAEHLRDANYLLAEGHEMTAASPASDDDMPLPVIQLPDGTLGVFDPSHGPVSVRPEALRHYRVNMAMLFSNLTRGMGMPAGPQVHEIVPDLIWDLGSGRFSPRGAFHSVWFARRLGIPLVINALRDAAAARPTERLRIVLSSSSDLEGRTSISGALLLSLSELLARPDKVQLSLEFLRGRIQGAAPYAAGPPLRLSTDGRRLMLRDELLVSFRSKDRIDAVRLLLSASEAGRAVKTGEITDLGSLRRFFGGATWSKLGPLLDHLPSGWRIKP